MEYNYYFTNRHVRYILTLIGLFLLVSSSIADNSRWHFYEPPQTMKLDNLESDLLADGFKQSYPRSYVDERDTIDVYEKDGLYIIVSYCPKSKIIYSYNSNWNYRASLEDCKSYYMTIHNNLQQKYGNPTCVMINRGQIQYVRDKNQLDSLDYVGLFDGKIHFRVYWETTDKLIELCFDYTTGEKNLSYKYVDLRNLVVRDEELASIDRNQQIESIIKWAIIIIVALLLIFASYKIARIVKKDKEIRIAKLNEELAKEMEEEAAREMLIRQERLERVKQLELTHANYIKGLTEKYGECDKTIKLKPQNNIYNFEILLFSKSKHVVIGEKELSFSDILDCTFNDDIKETETEETFEENSYATTKTNTSSMIGRSIAGGVLLGGVGAIIGGSTAKKDTVIQHGGGTSITHREIEHNYTIAITVKDLSNPVLHLNVGNNISLKNEIVSLMKVIMSMQ